MPALRDHVKARDGHLLACANARPPHLETIGHGQLRVRRRVLVSAHGFEPNGNGLPDGDLARPDAQRQLDLRQSGARPRSEQHANQPDETCEREPHLSSTARRTRPRWARAASCCTVGARSSWSSILSSWLSEGALGRRGALLILRLLLPLGRVIRRMVGRLVGFLLLIFRLGIGLGLFVVRGLVRVLLVRVVRVLLLILPAVARRAAARREGCHRRPGHPGDRRRGSSAGVCSPRASATRALGCAPRPARRQRLFGVVARYERERVIVALDRRVVFASQKLQVAERDSSAWARSSIGTLGRATSSCTTSNAHATSSLRRASSAGVICGLTGIVTETPAKALADAKQRQTQIEARLRPFGERRRGVDAAGAAAGDAQVVRELLLGGAGVPCRGPRWRRRPAGA